MTSTAPSVREARSRSRSLMRRPAPDTPPAAPR
jgi:hypothetical protein